MIVYNVNKEKGIVVARFEGDKEYWRQSLYEMCANILDPTYTDAPNSIIDNVVDDFQDFVGKAKLHPHDKWNEETGKKLAKKKLLEKWYHVKDRVLEDLKDFVEDNYENTIERIDKRLDAWM